MDGASSSADPSNTLNNELLKIAHERAYFRKSEAAMSPKRVNCRDLEMY